MRNFENNFEKMEEGYNVCPHCGRSPFATMESYDAYHVGCAFCGLSRGVTTFLDDPLTEKVKEETRKEWNRKCLSSSYTDGVIELLGWQEGDFLLTWRHDDVIVSVAHDVDELVKIIGENEPFYNVYRIKDNFLVWLGTSMLVAAIIKTT